MLMLKSTHTALMAAKDAECAFLRDALAKAEARATDAETRAVALLDLTKPAPKPVPIERTVDAVMVAIGRRAGGSTALRSQLAEFARDQRRANVPDSEIILQIEDWTYRPSGQTTTERDRREADNFVADLLG